MVCSVHVQSPSEPSDQAAAGSLDKIDQVSSNVEIEEDNDDDAVYTPVDRYSTGRDKASIVAEKSSSEEKRKK